MASARLNRLIGLLADPDPQVLVGLLGILKADHGFVPIDPCYPNERVAWILEDCACEVLVTQRRHLARSRELASVTAGLRDIICLDGETGDTETVDGITVHVLNGVHPGEAAAGTAEERRDPCELRSLAYIVYTSGSTGRPKGVPISHENLVPMLTWGCDYLGLGEGTRVLQSLSFCFDFGIFEQLTTVLAGGTLCFPGEAAGDPAAFVREIGRHSVNTLHTTPAFARELVAVGGVDGDLESLEIVHLGGEALSRDTVARVREAAPRSTVYNGYGPTEATINSTIFRVGGSEDAAWPVVPIGRRSADNALYILDRASRLVPFGARGELHVGGIGVARGYLSRPDLTAERFVPDPFGAAPGGRLYRTGDLVRYLPGGNLEFLGRIDQQVKIRGFRVEPGEVEAALREHPAVREVAVIAWPDPSGNLRLVAYVVTGEGTDAPELRAFLSRRLPPHMVPAVFVGLEALPRTPNGKLDRRELPEPEPARGTGMSAPPETPLEETVAKACREVLGLTAIGRHDDLFELGCHSLLATKIVARLRDALGVQIALRRLFETPTVAGLAIALEQTSRGGEMPPIGPAPRDGELPLSFAQERIWFLHQLEPESVAYHVPRALRIRGPLSVPLLEAVFSEIVRRHEILRTTFPSRDGKPLQVINAPWQMSIPVVDLSACPVSLREERLARFIVEHGRRAFDLERGPLMRFSVVRMDEDEHALVMTEHHFVHDGWTQGVLLKDFLALYAAFGQGEPSPLPPLPVQYADFAVWQRRWLQGEILDRQLTWWRERLAGAPELLELPTDLPRPAVRTAGGDAIHCDIPLELANALRRLSRELGATLFMTLTAAFGVFLWRYSSQEDFCLGTVLANRRVREIEGLLGMIVNTLVLRLDLAGEPTFEELTARVREICLGAYEHQDIPIEKLVEALRPERSLSHTPLFQVMFSLLDTPTSELELPGLQLELMDSHNRSSKFDLNVTAIPHAEQRIGGSVNAEESEITLLVEYSTDLFHRETVERLAGHYLNLLAGVVAGPWRRISELPLLSRDERAQILTWSTAPAEARQGACVHELVAARAEEAPAALAVAAGGEKLTYGELTGRAGALAIGLRSLGVGPEVRVAVCAERSPDLIVGLLAVLAAGGAYVPLDPAYPAERLAFLLGNAGAPVILTQEHLLPRLPQTDTRTVLLDGMPGEPAALPSGYALPENLAYVIYTSGSTGTPKGVEISHASLMNLVDWHLGVYGVGPSDRAPQVAALGFDAAAWEIWPYLAAGASLHLPDEETRATPAKLQAWLAAEGITIAFLPTPLAEAMLDLGGPGGSLRTLLTGGDRLRRHAQDSAAFELVNHYGPTEGTVVATWDRVGAPFPGALYPPIGRPMASARTHVLGPGGEPAPVGVPGELWIGGAGLARGYVGRPDLTAERFRPDPLGLEPGARLYVTGDRVRQLADGRLDFLGRADDQVKVRGVRIEPAEIEAALATHPGTRAAAVLARQDGAGGMRLIAYVVPREEGAANPADLLEHLRRRLPEVMVPTAFVELGELPLTSHGKVDRRALAALALPGDLDDRTAYVPPRTSLEEVLCSLWAELLGRERVGVRDVFFDLGGHSLLATRLLSRVREVLGAEVPLRQLFERPTPEGLAQAVEELRGARTAAPPLQPARRGGPGDDLPLSFAQERLWFLDQLEPGSTAYIIPAALTLSGPLDVRALAAACNEIVRRHEALRTTFAAVDGRPVQRISPPAAAGLPVVDLAELPGEPRQSAVELWTAEEVRRPFDLAGGPLTRLTLFRLGQEQHRLLLALHHIIADGWSIGVLARELRLLYTAVLAGTPSPLPELPVQYADYAIWQRNWLRGEVLEAQISWWREQLADAPPFLDLPFDHPLPALASRRAGRVELTFSAKLTAALGSLSRQSGATLFMTLLAGWSTLLSRYTSQEDVLVGSPIANRTRLETESLIGFFVNTLVLRTRLSGDPGFSELIARVRRATLGTYDHQELPFERLVEELQPERHLAHPPLFQVLFALQEGLPDTFDLAGARVELLRLRPETAKLDLTLLLEQREEGLSAALEYSRDLFDAATAERLLEHWRNILDGAVAAQETRIAELPLLSDSELRQAVAGWNQTRALYPRESTLHALFEAQVEAAPEATAVVGEGAAWTYRELNRRANQLAHHLRALGVGPEVPVGLCLERSPELIAAVLGILKAGGVYVPLDPSYPGERLLFLLGDSGVRLLVSREPLIAELPLGAIPAVDLDRDAGALARQSGENPPPADSADHLAYVMYTSGSTGVPKGVAVPHRAVVRLVQATDYVRLGSAEVFLQLAPASFDASTFEIWGALLNGARLVVHPGRVPLLDELGETLERHGVTTLWLTAGLFHQMVDEGLASLAGVRQLLAGGDVLSPTHVRRVLEELPGCTLINGYGPTENTTFTCCRPLTGPGEAGASVPIGRPIANTRVYLLDPALRPVPVGVAGELYAGGDGLARGYLRRPELTAERFVPDPFGAEAGEPGGRLYRTGDLVRRQADGDIEFLGRIDQQVKIRGFRVEPGEVEAALVQHPRVREAVVIACQVAGARALVAYVVSEEGPMAAGELREHLRQRLPEHMIPAAFVALSELPLTPNGKVDRRALPAPERESSPAEQEEPRTPIEEVLAGLWAEVLGLERVGVHEDFFALGGHSLLATQVLSRLRGVFSVELPLQALFEQPRVAELAPVVEELRRGGSGLTAPPLVPVPRDGDLPLSFAQERLWFLDQLDPGSTVYNIPAAFTLSGTLDVRALTTALGEILRRHEALRTTFTTMDGRPVQRSGLPTTGSLAFVDLTGLASGPRHAAAERLTAEAARRLFDLAQGPLVWLTLLRLGNNEHRALLSMHHIVSDGWSMGVLIRELMALYTAFVTGARSPLPELPVQYADYAVWQRAWLQGEVLEAQLAWWVRELEGVPSSLDLPFDRPRSAVSDSRGGQVEITLSTELTAALEALGRRNGATLFMVLLAGWSTLLSRYTAQEDVLVGSPIANRTRLETEGLIGFFVNTLVLRTDLSGDPGFDGLTARVRHATVGAYDHQDLPFERLVEELQPERHLAHTPLFQAFFALQNAPKAILDLPDLMLAPVSLPAGDAKLDLSLLLERGPQGVVGTLRYPASLFDAVTLKRAAGHLRTLLASAAADPGAPLSLLPLLSEPEAAQVSVEWNDTGASRDGLTFPERFAIRATRMPQQPAVACEDEVLTYGALNERANRLAHRLRQIGVGPEVRVGVLLDRSAEMIVALLGVMKAGGAYVPLDPTSPEERLARVAEHSRMVLALTREGLTALLPHTLPLLSLDVDLPQPVPESSEEPVSPVVPQSAAYVIYTSGSTGQPKGVVVEHRQLTSYLEAVLRRIDLPEGASFATVSTFAADLGKTMIFAALGTGGCLHVIAQDRIAEAERLGDYFERHPVDCLKIVPSHLAALLSSARRPERVLPRRLLMLGGEASHWQDLDLLSRLAPGCRVLNHYGPTETTVGVTTFEPTRSAVSQRSATLPLGRPLANSRAYLLGARMAPVPAGVPGELFLGGGNVTRGYLAAPALTAERFLPDPFSPEPGARMYRTGDLVRHLPDGNLVFLGRIDHQVKIRGYRVELGEVEAALHELAAILEVVVVAREGRLVAYLVSVPGVELTSDTLRRSLERHLPIYMVPSIWVFLERMPLTANGKTDRSALPEPEADRAGTGAHESPHTPTEDLLAGLFADVLEVDSVRRGDDFFSLGGHSLLAVRLMVRVRETFGIELPLRTLFEAPAVADLAKRVDHLVRQAQGLAVPPLERVSRSLELPLSFAQQSLWVIDRMEGGNTAYNGTAAVELAGRLDVAALAGSFRDVVQRHEILRTSFALSGDEPRQVIQSELELPLPLTDLTALPESLREGALKAVRRELRQPFDLGRPPLLRTTLLRFAPSLHVLVLCQHHIVSDAWSVGVLVHELAVCYEARAQGRQPELPVLPVQYADWSHWQQQRLRGDTLEQLLAFWRRQLGSAPPAARLPVVRPVPAVRTSRGGRLVLPLPAELEPVLRALARREGVTLFMLLLGVFQTLLHRSTSQEDLVLVVAVSGRDRLETEGLIGCFLNMLPLRTSLAGDPSFRRLLQRVRETCLDAFAHQDLPFERLVGELRLRGADGRSPFQVAFGVRGAPPPLPKLPELMLRPLDSDPDAARLDLTLWVTERPEGLSASWTYSADLFEREEVERLHRVYEALLAAVIVDPEACLRDLALCTTPGLESPSAPSRRWEDLKKRKLRESHRRSVRSGGEIGRSKLS